MKKSLPIGILMASVLLAGSYAQYASAQVEVDQFPNSEADITLQFPDGTMETMMLSGPTTVHVLIGPNGEADDSNGNGLDDAETEIVMMDLSGGSSLGPVMLMESAVMSSMGMLEEQANLTPGIMDVSPFGAVGNVDSFFDVFFQIEVAGLMLHNDKPLRVQAVLTHKPPAAGERYCELGPVILLDASGNPSGVTVVAACHTPNPTTPVGGEILPIDMTALLVIGALTNAYWTLPMIAGVIAGAVVAIIRARKQR